VNHKNHETPLTARGTDLMCDAPSTVPERQLRELDISIRK
jgi:aspartyl-tRNA synthetase